MRKMTFVFCLLLFGFAFASQASAQDEPKPAQPSKTAEPAHFYRLEFVVQELGQDGKVTNSRTYRTTVSTSTDSRDQFASIRANSRIPMVTGTVGQGNAVVNTQFQYQDVGVNIDAQRARDIGHQLSIELTANITSVAGTDTSVHEPILRQNKWQSVVLIPIGKPTVAFTSDSLDSKGSMQLMITATPLQ